MEENTFLEGSGRSPFDREPGFYLEDNRRERAVVPVTKETLERKHETLLPRHLVEGRTILDLGSCLGATGHWCLSMGAKKYVGVEVQQDYVQISQKLLSKNWPAEKFEIVQSELEDYLDRLKEGDFDLIVMCGVLYVFVDYYSVLEKMSRIAKQGILIESIYPQAVAESEAAIVEFIRNQTMVLPSGKTRAQGVGSRISPRGLNFVMETLGFSCPEGVIYPAPVEGIHDAFHEVLPGWRTPVRFLMRFQKGSAPVTDLAQELKTGKFSRPKIQFDRYWPGLKKSWKFDSTVAENFEKIAKTSIPRYQEVIDTCVQIARKAFPQKDCRILDVGSATGYTLDQFIQNGFRDVWGVENSQAMVQRSKHSERVILSDIFPKELGPFQIVCANWTLHFVKDRAKYLAEIYEGLEPEGFLILSDKVQANDFILDLYHDFKRSNGLTEQEITDKSKAIRGVLEPYPLTWYLTELKRVGFQQVDVINAHYHFNTILARK